MYPVASILKDHLPSPNAESPENKISTSLPLEFLAILENLDSLPFCIYTVAESEAFKPLTITLKSDCENKFEAVKKNIKLKNSFCI